MEQSKQSAPTHTSTWHEHRPKLLDLRTRYFKSDAFSDVDAQNLWEAIECKYPDKPLRAQKIFEYALLKHADPEQPNPNALKSEAAKSWLQEHAASAIKSNIISLRKSFDRRRRAGQDDDPALLEGPQPHTKPDKLRDLMALEDMDEEQLGGRDL
jgi:hypothetical protein